ncbi:MAG: GDP-L-fucose synthase [Pseudomonadota bacterium]
MHTKKLWIAGETGMVGRALIRHFQDSKYELLSAPHSILDLTNQSQTFHWLEKNKPDAVIMAAGRVGGIGANASDRAGFLYENTAMAQNVIHGSYKAGVKRLVYMGSSCVYPKEAEQPIREEALLTAPLESTNEGYALAKIIGIKLCQYYQQQYGVAYKAVMPCNLYGSYDHFDLNKSHVIPALILKIHWAKKQNVECVTLWGTGKPLREFLHVDDLAKAIALILENKDQDPLINIGSGIEISIKELALLIKETIGFTGEIIFDESKPDGTMRKVIDSSKVKSLGWKPNTLFEQGLSETYQWYLKNVA